LKQFNVRGRAHNFTNRQLPALLKEAEKGNVKVYIALNTVIKNTEINELLDYLHFLNRSVLAGIIIQDWGVYNITRRFFPELSIPASTQMGIHNSVRVNFSAILGFDRVVLARH